MSRSIVLLALLVVTTLADTASADGLIYQLPEDGTGVTYDMEIKQTVRGRENTTNGTLTIKSVGETILGGESCRWIECKMVTRLGRFDQVVISKTLIPEKQLGKGKSPLDHVIRHWHKFGKSDAREMMEMAGKGVAIPYLAGPPKDDKSIEAIEVESKLGNLDCPGATGTLEFESDKTTIRFEFENRLHEKAPFGVVAAVWKFEMKKDGQIEATGTTTLTLAEIDSAATSDLPDKH